MPRPGGSWASPAVTSATTSSWRPSLVTSSASRPARILPYRTLLGEVARALGDGLGHRSSDADAAAFGASVADWPAFPDSHAALAPAPGALPPGRPHQLRRRPLRSLPSAPGCPLRRGRDGPAGGQLQAGPAQLRGSARAPGHPPRAHPPRGAEPLPRPRAGQGAGLQRPSGSTAGTAGRGPAPRRPPTATPDLVVPDLASLADLAVGPVTGEATGALSAAGADAGTRHVDARRPAAHVRGPRRVVPPAQRARRVRRRGRRGPAPAGGATSTARSQTALELGSGGGNLASHLAARLRLTLTDVAPGMLDLSRRINPGVEHLAGRHAHAAPGADVRCRHRPRRHHVHDDRVRPSRGAANRRPSTCDRVAPPSSCRTGCWTRTARAPSTAVATRAARGLRYLEWDRDLRPGSTTVETDYIIVTRDGRRGRRPPRCPPPGSLRPVHLDGPRWRQPGSSPIGSIGDEGLDVFVGIRRADPS